MDNKITFWTTLILGTIAVLVIAFLLYYFLYVKRCEKKGKRTKLKYWMLVVLIVVCSTGVGVGVPLSNYLYDKSYTYDTDLYTTDNIFSYFKYFNYENVKKAINADDNVYMGLEFYFDVDRGGRIMDRGTGGIFICRRKDKMVSTNISLDGEKTKFKDTEFVEDDSYLYKYVLDMSYFKDSLYNFDWQKFCFPQKGNTTSLVTINFFDYTGKTECLNYQTVFATSYTAEIKDNMLVYHDGDFTLDGYVTSVRVQYSTVTGSLSSKQYVINTPAD